MAAARWIARIGFWVSLLTLAAVPSWWVASRPAPVDAGALPGIRPGEHDIPPAVTTTTASGMVGPSRATPTSAARPDALSTALEGAPAVPVVGKAGRRAAAAASPSGVEPSERATAESAEDRGPPPTTVAARSGRLADLPPPAPRPIRLTIEQLDVTADVFHIGIDESGALNVPTDVHDVGWYRGGVRPGERGSAVLVAHVDSHSQGVGAFFGLADLAVGSRIVVEDDQGGHQWWQVEARRDYHKHELPIDTLFRRGGAAVLTLVTCGGDFDPATRSYDSNVVVYATPITDRVEGPRVPPA